MYNTDFICKSAPYLWNDDVDKIKYLLIFQNNFVILLTLFLVLVNYFERFCNINKYSFLSTSAFHKYLIYFVKCQCVFFIQAVLLGEQQPHMI